MINISYVEVPMEYGNNKRLKDNMQLTGAISDSQAIYYPIQPIFINKNIEFKDLFRMVKSDYRQYSPFEFSGGYKQTDRWKNDNQNILILDIDSDLSIEEAKEIFKQYENFICTTKSHQKDKKGIVCDRFRVFLKSFDIPKGNEYFDFMREFEIRYPFIDKQVNTKTGAFLGFSDCEYWYNDGENYVCYPLHELAKARKSLLLKQKDNAINKQYEPLVYDSDFDINAIKQHLNRETVANIIQDFGFEVDRNFKFKYRKEERSPSASIHQGINPLIKDFGSDLSTDIIGFIQIVKGCSFKEAINYLRGFLNA